MTRSVPGPAFDQFIQNVVIVGFGRAGRIHRRAYDALAEICRVSAVVEPNPDRRAEIEASLPGVDIYQELGEALKELGGDIIIDFCVPAKINLELVETALSFSIRKFLIEKPLGWDVASTNALVSRLQNCEAVYLDTYAASRGVQELLKRMDDLGSAPERVDVLFHKNRISDSLSNRGFIHDAVPSAWMIEGPHMLSISRQIAGEITQISDASTFDMQTGSGQVLPEHGGGHALLEHENGAVTHLDLSLCSSRNERRIEVQLRNKIRMAVDLPPSKTTQQCSVLEVLYPSGERDVVRFEDRPMEQCVQNAIRHLAGEKVAVSSLSDGLAVCSIVEGMTEKKHFWQSAPKQWKHFGPPLRPCPEDIRVMENRVAQWMDETSANSCNVLLCGVTPEIVEMDWPAGTRLWAVEKSRAMIEEVWPAKQSKTKQPLQAEWTSLPFGPGSFDIVIGDGCFTSLEYPRLQLVLIESLRNVLRCNGLLIMRFFVQKDEPEQPDDIFRDILEDRIGSFHVMKWRLAMSLQESASEGVRVDDIWKVWDEAGITTDWPAQAVNTIDTYKGSDHRLIFTSRREIGELLSTSFEEVAYSEPGYELGERCPILVYSPRKLTSQELGAT
jgi:predicted dehydrogenase/SAM-dependent methyltransferase